MKLNICLIVALQICFQTLTIKTADLQALEAQRELHRLAKIKLHGEPLVLPDTYRANHVAFSSDGKQLAVARPSSDVIIYDLAAEKTKRLDREIEKMKKEIREAELAASNLTETVA